MRVTSTPLGVSGGEDGVDQDECTDDLGGHTGTDAITGGETVGAATVAGVVRGLEGFDQSHTANGTEALSHYVHHCSHQRHFTSQEQPKCHRRINMPTYFTKIIKLYQKN